MSQRLLNASLEISVLLTLIVIGDVCLLIHHCYYVEWACRTSPPPPGALPDGVRKLIELQVHGRAAWEVGEALSLGDVVLHFLQVGEQWRLLRCSAMKFGLLHGDADRALLSRPLSHAERLQRRETDTCQSPLQKKQCLVSLRFYIQNHQRNVSTPNTFYFEISDIRTWNGKSQWIFCTDTLLTRLSDTLASKEHISSKGSDSFELFSRHWK